MQHQEFEPPEELRDVIKCFWYNSRDFGEPASTFEILPDGYAEIIFHFGSGCSISTPDGWQLMPSPFIMGLLNQPALLSAKNRLEIIGVRCFPWTVFDLLDLPSGQDVARCIKHPIAQLQPRLKEWMEAGRVDQALTAAKQALLNARSSIATDGTLLKAGVILREANGSMPVREVAAAAHASVRTLERKFKHSSGYSVKDVSSLIRFEQARNRLWLHPDSNISGLAQDLGYADQSHLSREFKRYSGTTPAAFARKARAEKQTVNHDFVAFIQD